MHKLSHILRLGLKELTSLRHDSVLLLFLFYALPSSMKTTAPCPANSQNRCYPQSSRPRKPCPTINWTSRWTAASTRL